MFGPKNQNKVLILDGDLDRRSSVAFQTETNPGYSNTSNSEFEAKDRKIARLRKSGSRLMSLIGGTRDGGQCSPTYWKRIRL